MNRWAIAALASGVVTAVLVLAPTSSGSARAGDGAASGTKLPSRAAAVDRGRSLFEEGCSSCHGVDADGIDGKGPSLHGAGAIAADFYLRTGRMPLSQSDQQPVRADPAYSNREINALVAYVGSLGGPPVPKVAPAAGNLAEGLESFTDHCAGCHQVVARGGIVTGGFAPSLREATPAQVAEAVRVGPYLMPAFPPRQIPARELDSIARYVSYSKRPDDRGGWGIGNIGPIPEGMVAWLLAIVTLLLTARAIGERTR